jgi:hypothetical protein
MTGSIPRLLGYVTVGAGAAAAGYVGLVTGACPLDLGIGRRVRPLGPQELEMAAPRELVFDVIAEPYLGRTPRTLADKLRVLEAGSDMVLAAHFTPLGGRLGLVAQTVETVRFTRPERVDFRLVRGPVPHVVEAFALTERPAGDTLVAYQGEIGADLWAAGQRWCDLVADRWEQTVAASLAAVKTEAERRAAISQHANAPHPHQPPRQPGGSRTTCRAPRASPSPGPAPPQRPAGNPSTPRVDHRGRPAPTALARGAEPTGTDWTLEEALDG